MDPSDLIDIFDQPDDAPPPSTNTVIQTNAVPHKRVVDSDNDDDTVQTLQDANIIHTDKRAKLTHTTQLPAPTTNGTTATPGDQQVAAKLLSAIHGTTTTTDDLADATFNEYTPQSVDRWIVDNTDTTKTCIAEICYPPNWPAERQQRPQPQPIANPAKTYSYTLDPFQQLSIECIERNESVLVSAHTSAGKTTVAEYAVAASLKNGQRVIYTSPIKALSNQKYRELHAEFTDVGLMTGDITINPTASCLVMTTEILRNMLYKGSEMMREIAWVVFDEVHYMRNKERGVVWEETFILLPDKVRYVLLSATIPNATEFACWIAKLHNQVCNVVYTDYRPTPLQHYIYPSGADGLYLVVDDKSQFRADNFEKALSAMKVADTGAGDNKGGSADIVTTKHQKSGKKKGKGGAGGGVQNDIYKIVRMLIDRKYEPVIVFSFSKKECEAYALQMSQLDLCDSDEKQLIQQIFTNAIDSLSADDRQLPQVDNILPLLMRGIGIHHGGLLPLLKEVIEIMFQESLLKVLFSTETFSMGLNMPAKTVIFTALRKYDGATFRTVSSGEYIQMSGRAGRRGIDERGICILMLSDDTIEPAAVKQMIQGAADRLDSSFKLSYNMILNLLRVEDQTPIKLMCRSFVQFQNTQQLPKYHAKLDTLNGSLVDLEQQSDTSAVKAYYDWKTELEKCQREMQTIMCQPQYILPFLNGGRMANVTVRTSDGKQNVYGWGIILAHSKRTLSKANSKAVDNSELTAADMHIVEVLLHVDSSTIPSAVNNTARTNHALKQQPLPAPVSATKPEPGLTEWYTVQCQLHDIVALSSVRLSSLPPLNQFKAEAVRQKYGGQVNEVRKRLNGTLPLLDPGKDMKVDDGKYVDSAAKAAQLTTQLSKHELHGSEQLTELYAAYEQQLTLQREIDRVTAEIHSNSIDVAMYNQLTQMTQVLRALDHTESTTDSSGSVSYVISLKGKVACEISTSDELLATELMFTGVYNDMTVQQCVALISCLVYNEKSSDTSAKINEALQMPYKQLQQCATHIGQCISNAGIQIDVDEYVQSFQPQLIDVVYAWCNGAKFSEVCKMTDIFEGSIIRALRRLEELLRQYANAAKAIGNIELEVKFAAGIELLKRDIVFAASLYL